MTEQADLNTVLDRFEQAWRENPTPPEIETFLHSDDTERLQLLEELIALDLEYRWRLQAEPKLLEDYSRAGLGLPEIAELSSQVIGEEYRARQLWGDRPEQDEFLQRFPNERHNELAQVLLEIDRELELEADQVPVVSHPPLNTGFDPRAPLDYSDFLLQQLIGAGRVGKVYRAWQRSLDRPVALKFLRKAFLAQPEVVERFLAEARTVAQLQHPGIVGIHGLGRTPQGGYFLVMPLIAGQSLAQVLRERGPVAPQQALAWFRQAAGAMQHAHARGIVHCDLKPGNLLLAEDGKIHVTDFGLARRLDQRGGLEFAIAGTAPYMAPEQVSGHWGQIGPHTDVYGLGAVLYHLLSGQPPWPSHGHNLADILAQVISAQQLPEPRALRSEIPAELNALCLRCLARSSAARIANMQTCLQESEALVLAEQRHRAVPELGNASTP